MARKRKITGVITLLFALIASQLLTIANVCAVADPDSNPTLPYIYFNRHLYETDDMFLYGMYNIPYAAPPTETVDQTYVFNLIDVDGTTVLGSYLAYPEDTNGYNKGVFAFYFSAASAPTWDPVGDNYTIQILQNPAVFPTPDSWTFVIPASAFSSQTTQAANQTETYSHFLTITRQLENAWNEDLLSQQDSGTTLSATGEDYYRSAVFGLQVLCPDLFFLQNVAIDTSTRAWGSSQSDYYKTLLAGADLIYGTGDDNWIYETSLKPTADLFNIPVVLLVGIGVLAICVVVIYFSVKQFQSPKPGYVASLLIIMCGGMLFLGLQVVALIAFGIALIGGMILFFRRA